MHVENDWQSGKEMKNVKGTSTRSRKLRHLRWDRFIVILKRRKGKRIDEWYVLVLPREVRLKRSCRNARSPCLPESAKGQVRTGDDRIQI